MKDLTLYQIEEEGRKLLDLLDGEITEDVDALLSVWEGQLERKAEGYCQIISHFTALATARDTEAKRLRDLAAADFNRAQYLKDRLKAAMERLNIKKLETPLFKIAIQKNGGKPAVRWDGPIEELPQELRKVEVSLDKTAALEAWELGMAPAALIVERGTHLSIR